MSDPIDLSKKRQEREAAQQPHCSGVALCLECKHEWAAVWPDMYPVALECPECGTFKGVPAGVSCAPPEADVLECHRCRNRFMQIAWSAKQPPVAICAMCGSETRIDMIDLPF
jgi:hypothetical protein